MYGVQKCWTIVHRLLVWKRLCQWRAAADLVRGAVALVQEELLYLLNFLFFQSPFPLIHLTSKKEDGEDRLGVERPKRDIWTVRKFNHDFEGRIRCYRCSTLFKYESYLSTEAFFYSIEWPNFFWIFGKYIWYFLQDRSFCFSQVRIWHLWK